MKDAMRYLEIAGALAYYSKGVKSADGRSLVFQAGSPEGLGTDVMRTNCKNIIMFYDELSSLVSKAGIEGSGMNSALLQMYESGIFSNSVKSKKDCYDIEPNSYSAALLSSTTNEKFAELWAHFAGDDTGLNERFTWVMEPKELPPHKIPPMISFAEGALQTRKVMERAVEKRRYDFFDKTPLLRISEIYGDRAEIRAEKWALYFAIDLGLEEIDEDCVARGIEMVKYEHAVSEYQKTFEANNDDAKIQQGVVRRLKMNGGRMAKTQLKDKMNANKYGGYVWDRAYRWLVDNRYVRHEGRGTKGDPVVVVLVRDMHFGRK
jgi:hypothetical protein